jgi:hypothetical protein
MNSTQLAVRTLGLQIKQLLQMKMVKFFYGLENDSRYNDSNWEISQSEFTGPAHRESGRMLMKLRPQ